MSFSYPTKMDETNSISIDYRILDESVEMEKGESNSTVSSDWFLSEPLDENVKELNGKVR
jgi:hypothetical protein